MDVKVEKNLIPAIQRGLGEALDEAVRKAAFNIQRGAQMRAPVDTGALKNSIHTVTDKQSGYGQAAASAHGANPDAQVFPEVKPSGPHEAVVAVAAEYGFYVERGTVRQAGQPFLTPAVEEERPKFAEAVAQAIRKAVDGA